MYILKKKFFLKIVHYCIAYIVIIYFSNKKKSLFKTKSLLISDFNVLEQLIKYT